MKYKKKLSICMMVKNEEKYLDQCLTSLKPLLNNIKSELIIVDTGSEDNTVEIAKRHTKKVYFHNWNNDFGSMRNQSIKYATGEWILILDADEIFDDASNLIDFLNSPVSRKYNTGMLTIKSITTEDNKDTSGTVGILRLFRNQKGFCYRGAIHEQPQYKHPIIDLNTIVLHYGYLSTDKEMMELKFRRNKELIEEELEKDPENIYYWFQLSQSYGMYKDYKKALEMNLKAYEIGKKNEISFKDRMYIYTHLAQMYYFNRKFKELEEICLEALAIEDGYIDLYYYLGKAQKFLKKDQDAIKSYKEYLAVLEDYRQAKITKDASLSKTTLNFYEDAYLDLCILFQRIEDKEEAIKYAQKISKDYVIIQVIPYLIELYIDLNRYEELRQEYVKLLNNSEEIQERFCVSLENNMAKMEENEKYKLIELFSTGNCSYSLLNKIRICIKETDVKVEQKIIDEIKDLNFESLPIFYADILYFLLDKRVSLKSTIQNLREYNLQNYINYLSHKYNNFSEVILKYLDDIQDEKSLTEVRFIKVLSKNALLLDKLDKEEFRTVWDRYLEKGTFYISQIYHQRIIEGEMIYDAKDSEDAFLIYMLLAEKIKETDRLAYVKYLRKALKVYPNMKKGIEMLIKEIKEEDSQNDHPINNPPIQNELEELKKGVKKNIHMLLKANKAAEARVLVDEYLKIVPGDMEMQKLKEELQLM